MKKTTLLGCLLLAGALQYSMAQTVVWGGNNSRTEGRNDAGLNGNAGAISGFFETAAPVNFPAGAGNWWHLLDVRHSNPTNNYAMQFAGSFFDQQLYFRKTNNNPAQAWSRVLLETSGSTQLSASAVITAPGRLHITGDEILYVLNRNGMTIGKEWGGTGSLSVQGNAVIGPVTSTPAGYSLYVGTGILTEKVKVAVKTGADWADHVFAGNYNLMPLEQVAEYIRRHKHLPGIPAAAEMVKEGNDLGKTDARLLEKIEELTLYVIDLNKKLAQLTEQDQMRQGQIEKLQQKINQYEKANQ